MKHKTIYFLLLTGFCFCRISFGQTGANGFIFGEDQMCRFSADDPGKLTIIGIGSANYEPYKSYYRCPAAFANRPWLFYLNGWGSGRYILERIDTATGEYTGIDMEPQMNFNSQVKAMSYEKSSNSIYFLTRESGTPGQFNFIRSMDMNLRGSLQKFVCHVKDSLALHGFSVGPDGFGYSFNDTGSLDKIDILTGEVKSKTATGLRGSDIMDAVINPANGKLYITLIRDSSYTELRTVDISNGKSERITSWDGIYAGLAFSGNVYPPPLPAPELVSPLGYIDNFSPLLVWKPVPGAIGYFVNYSPFEPSVNRNWWGWAVVYDTTFRVPDKVFDNSFNNYWWIAAFDSSGTGYFSKMGVTGANAEER